MLTIKQLQEKYGLLIDQRMHGSKKGAGWENCTKPITNKEVWGEDIPDKLIADVMFETEYGPLETCSVCRGQKHILGRLGNKQYLQCRDCGVYSHRPIHDGLVMTTLEEIDKE